LKATEQPIDTGTAAGKCFLDMLGVFAEFEINLRRERQLKGIAKAKAKAAGIYKGPPASIDAALVRAMKAQWIGASEIAKALKIGRALRETARRNCCLRASRARRPARPLRHEYDGKLSWNRGRADAMRGAPSKCPKGLHALSYATRTRRDLRLRTDFDRQPELGGPVRGAGTRTRV
jgi:hypothetical protein